MKISVVPIILLCLSLNLSIAQNSINSDEDIKYFDENYNPISRHSFYLRIHYKGFLDIKGDSLNHKILSRRTETGTLNTREVIDSLISLTTLRKIDPTKPLVIFYYPGKDDCNSSSTATKGDRRVWAKRIRNRVFNKTKTEPFYIYKERTGLEKYAGIITWHKDPSHIIESLFFKYHYPCSSFVVISADGDYLSYFGEYTIEAVREAVHWVSEN